MFRQEKRVREILKEDELIAEKADVIYKAESKIDPNRKIYLMTWSPDPKELPDCDFVNQHTYLVGYVISYLLGCYSGAACVESTQMGNPHYHLWYQCYDGPAESYRIRWVKVMQKLGNVKIETKGVRYYGINKWYSARNALYYYKKDSIGTQLLTPYNPVAADSPQPDIDYSDYSWFFYSGRSTAAKMHERATQVQELYKFYGKSI